MDSQPSSLESDFIMSRALNQAYELGIEKGLQSKLLLHVSGTTPFEMVPKPRKNVNGHMTRQIINLYHLYPDSILSITQLTAILFPEHSTRYQFSQHRRICEVIPTLVVVKILQIYKKPILKNSFYGKGENFDFFYPTIDREITEILAENVPTIGSI